jgi:hypothetical protein
MQCLVFQRLEPVFPSLSHPLNLPLKLRFSPTLSYLFVSRRPLYLFSIRRSRPGTMFPKSLRNGTFNHQASPK